MSRRPRNPDEAPKGKAWAVVRMSHVAGAGMDGRRPFVIVQRPSYTLKSDAERVAGHVDRRLQPSVELVDVDGGAS